MKLVAPLISLGVVLLLSRTLTPSKPVAAPDTNCKAIQSTQQCLAKFKTFERNSKGYTLYLEGASTYTVTSTKLPRNQLDKTLQVTLEYTPVGWSVTNWNVKY